MTCIEKFCYKLEPNTEKKSVLKSGLLGLIIYLILFKLYYLNYNSNSYPNLLMVFGIKYLIFVFTTIAFIIRLDEYFFYYKLRSKIFKIMIMNDIYSFCSLLLCIIISIYN
jgi:hypothetical protein